MSDDSAERAKLLAELRTLLDQISDEAFAECAEDIIAVLGTRGHESHG